MAQSVSPLLSASLAALALALPAASDGASETPPSDELDIALSAAFYNDASCLLTIDGLSRVGRTQIDASLGGEASRMLIHCDTRDDRRLTLLARGEQLGRDVRMDLLTPTETESRCPYKGWAHYWSVTVDGSTHEDIAWGYRTPLPESTGVAGLVCFYNEKVDIEIDGESMPRPSTKFS